MVAAVRRLDGRPARAGHLLRPGRRLGGALEPLPARPAPHRRAGLRGGAGALGGAAAAALLGPLRRRDGRPGRALAGLRDRPLSRPRGALAAPERTRPAPGRLGHAPAERRSHHRPNDLRPARARRRLAGRGWGRAPDPARTSPLAAGAGARHDADPRPARGVRHRGAALPRLRRRVGRAGRAHPPARPRRHLALRGGALLLQRGPGQRPRRGAGRARPVDGRPRPAAHLAALRTAAPLDR